MSPAAVVRHRTALVRTDLSRPMRLAIQDKIVARGRSVFDYGCGLGGDLKRLRRRGYRCAGWDPRFRPDRPRLESDIVNLGYVVNVIEDPKERAETLQSAWELTRQCLVVSARLKRDARRLDAESYADGCLTQASTFQKFYDQSELRQWIDTTLDASAVPAAPGVFYVFRDSSERQSFLASRFRRTVARAPRLTLGETLLREHRALFDPLADFLADRGRLPALEELPEAVALIEVAGSLKRAFRILERATADNEWETIRQERTQDLLVHLALVRFEGRPKYSLLPLDLQRDVKAFFGSYRTACSEADDLLFSAGRPELLEEAMRAQPVGKLTGNALYSHATARDLLAPILRVYEGCARAYVGHVEGANVLKLHRNKPQVSYLTYGDFDRDPHPVLQESLVVPLQTFRIRDRDYTRSENPPILHRKEELVAEDYPRRATFERLTRQEERWGLYEDVARIGNRRGWEEVLARVGVELRGHRVVRATR